MKYVFFICLFLLLLIGFLMSQERSMPEISEPAKLVDRVLDNTADIIEKRHGIKACGTGVAMPGGIIKEICLAFSTKGQFSKEHLRELLIDSAHEMIHQAKMNDKIEKFMKDPPFRIGNVQIIIYNHDKRGYGLKDPQISTAEISEGNLTYRTTDPNNEYRFKNEFKETYQEALDLINKNKLEKTFTS